jgi:hypothetical protein
VFARETASEELGQSEPLEISLVIDDENDNKPFFSQKTYSTQLLQIPNQNQEVMSFNVSDQDSGVYGVEGLRCFLLGEGSEK